MQEELHFEQTSHDKQRTIFFEGCHVFYDPVVEYMERLFSQEGWLCVCNNGGGHQEEEEESKWDTSLCFLNSKINFPNSIEEHNAIFFETLIRNQVLNSMMLHEKVDSSFRNG